MIIIGIAGGIGHGKTTLAEDFLAIEPSSIHLETSAVIADVINAWQAQTSVPPHPNDIAAINEWLALLPNVLEQKLHTTIDPSPFQLDTKNSSEQPELYEKLFAYLTSAQKNPSLVTTKITPANKTAYRALLQWLGGYVQIKLPPGVWFRELMRQAHKAEGQEIKLCVMSGVRFPADVQVIHDGDGYTLLVERPSIAEQDSSDPTERQRSHLQSDTILVNNAGLVELAACARRIYADIKKNKLQKRYEATNVDT